MITQNTASAVIPPAFQETPVGLRLTGKVTEAAVTEALRNVRDNRETLAWNAGDATLYGIEALGEKTLKQIATGLKLDYGTLRTLKWVSHGVPLDIRMPALSHRHHREVAVCLTLESKQAWLQLAIEKNWSARELGKQIAATKPTEVKPKVADCKVALKQIHRMAAALVTSWNQWSAEEQAVLNAELKKLSSIITQDSSGKFVVIQPTEWPAAFAAPASEIAAAVVQTTVAVSTAVS